MNLIFFAIFGSAVLAIIYGAVLIRIILRLPSGMIKCKPLPKPSKKALKLT